MSKEFITKQEIADELGVSLNILIIINRLKQYRMPNVFKRDKSGGGDTPVSYYIRKDIEEWYPYIKEKLTNKPIKEPTRRAEFTAKNLVGDGKTLMEWALRNKDVNRRNTLRNNVEAIRKTYHRMGYRY